MHVLVVTFEAKADRGDEWVRLLSAFLETQATAHGLARWSIGRSDEVPSKIVIVEDWPSVEQFGVFTQSAEFRAFMERMPEFVVMPPGGSFYRIVAGRDETSI
jgi:quinol monooxygenase YgiN